MNIINLNAVDGSKVLINLDNVSALKEKESHFGDKFTEVILSCGKSLDVKEAVGDIELRLGN